MRRTFLLVLLSAALLCLTAPIAAARPWVRVTSSGGITDQAAVARTADGILHVVWAPHPPGGGLNALLTDTISPRGHLGPSTTVQSGWLGIGNPEIAVRSDGSLAVVAGATRSGDPTETIKEQALWTSPDRGATWTLFPTDIANGGGFANSLGLALGPDGSTPFTSWTTTGGIFVHPGTLAVLPPSNLQSADGWSCCGYDPGLALDPASRQLVIAWYSNATSHYGIYAQRLDTTSAAPIGAPALMPGSQTAGQSIPPDERTEIAARAGGGLYVAVGGGYPDTTHALVWKFGSGSSMNVGSDSHGLDRVGVAGDPRGRLWAFWVSRDPGGDVIHVRRSNATVTHWGATVTMRPPAGESQSWSLSGNAQAGLLDLFSAFTVNGSTATWDAEILPGLTISAKGHRHGKLTVTVTDAGSPVSGALVRVGGRTARTNHSGVARVNPGTRAAGRTLRVTASHTGYTSASGQVRVPR
ncbi:MAG: hypothetical protein M3076_19605 [Actinomycetota bacterium]|nr:hypothetical protein [Actinomycetota bacterium]